MIEAVMFWNEPNNKSHWDFELDPEWQIFSEMTIAAAEAVAAVNPKLLRVLGGISPIDPAFVRRMADAGVLERLNVVALHGFPLDWNHWQIDEWPERLREIEAATDLPIWVSEVGVSSFGAEEVQEFGLRRTAELLGGRVPRIHWYSLYDLPPGRRRRDIARRKVLLITGTFTWACCARTTPRNAPVSSSINSLPRWESASGFISRIIGSTMQSGGCASSG